MPTTFSTIESVRKELHDAQARWVEAMEEARKLDNEILDWGIKIQELHEELDRMEAANITELHEEGVGDLIDRK